MAAVAGLSDPYARTGFPILRGTGLRLGELLDLELDCLWDTSAHGTWVKVPVGKLGTERTVPLDAETLAAFDEWMSHRGRQRPVTHPRDGRPAEFLFMKRGRRLSAYRLRHGLDDAVADAGLAGRDGGPLRVTPHVLRHTRGVSMPSLYTVGRRRRVISRSDCTVTVYVLATYQERAGTAPVVVGTTHSNRYRARLTSESTLSTRCAGTIAALASVT